MKINYQKYLNIVSRFYKKSAPFSNMFIFIIFSLQIGYVILKVGEYSKAEPTLNQVETKLQSVKKPDVDQEALSKLEELQERNVSIESLFDNGRTNPFEN